MQFQIHLYRHVPRAQSLFSQLGSTVQWLQPESEPRAILIPILGLPLAGLVALSNNFISVYLSLLTCAMQTIMLSTLRDCCANQMS